MKKITQKFITIFALLFVICFTANAQNNYSLSFSNDIVNFSTINNFPQTEFTVSFWENINSTAVEQAIISYANSDSDNEFLFIYISGGLHIYIGGNLLFISTTHSMNTWDYVTLTWNSITGDLMLFRNGVLESQSIFQQGFSISPTGCLVFGQDQDTCGGNFESYQALYGNLDNFQIWNTVLTQTEIQSNMNCESTGDEGLVGSWNFNEGSGDTVYDISGNGNHGVINDATFSEDIPENNCSELEVVNGCMDVTACNYNPEANMANGSCTYTEQGYDCQGNIDVQVGDEVFGGIVFYVDPSGERGLVAATEGIVDSYEWGCHTINVDGADGTFIGLGFQNTIDIVNQECVGNNSISAAQIAYDYVSSGYSDWFLPSKDELQEFYNFFGGDIFNHNDFWSSSEYDNNMAWNINTNNYMHPANKYDSYRGLMPIRSFGNWTMGCMDDNAYNYSDEANMDDGSCYPVIEGCMNSIAANYDDIIGDTYIDVNTEDGSCLFSTQVFDSLTTELSVFETVEDVQDYSMSFDGEDDNIIIPEISTYEENSHSILIWFKSSQVLQGDIISKDDESDGDRQWLLEKQSSNTIQAHVWTEDNNLYHVVSEPLEYEKWYHLAQIWDGYNLSLYIDGLLIGTTPTDQNGLDISDCPVRIGGGGNLEGAEFHLSSSIDNAQIWNIPLSEQLIKSYMSCPPTGEEVGLVGYWNFNESIGDTVYDNSIKANHGVINGAEYSEDVPESYTGCTDENALNYDESALCDNGSCVFGDDVVSNLEEELSVFETVEEEQDYSMSFDGLDDYVETSYLGISESNKRSISVSASNGYGCLFSYGGENDLNGLKDAFLCLLNEHNNSIEINIDYSTYQFQLDELLNWNNFTILLPNNSNSLSDLLVYQNGNLLEFLGGNDGVINTVLEVPINIGRNYRNQNYYSGTINNLIIWDAVLSQEQIQSYMSCPPTGQEEGLVGYWNFNEGSGDTVYDLSGNGNHGVIYGAEFSEDVPESYNGCTDANALNFDESALCDNGCCVFADDVLSNLEESYNQTVSGLNNELDSTNSTLNDIIDTWQSSIDLTNATLEEVSQMNQTIASFTTLIDLQEGWNMIGYGCPEPVNIEQGMSMYTDLVLLIKDNNGSVYLPEFNFNGIGDFTPGYGYQLKVSEPIEDFGLCGDYTTTESPEITDIETDNAQMQNDINCLTGNPQIGDHCYGGIVFYVEEGDNGKYGLVASNEDIGMYQWGCYGTSISGSDGQAIGTGYQNSIDIVAACSESPIAASEVLAYETGGYSDWFLPSFFELVELFNVIGLPSEAEQNWYWSSSEVSLDEAFYLNFDTGHSQGYNKGFENNGVIPIRSFGNWTMGCMDETACNFNPEASMANGSCAYAEQGYDCDGNIDVQVGDEVFGGIVFYVDPTGERGLVAATEGIVDSYEWGCHTINVDGADGTFIGLGFQNTIDIVNQECVGNNSISAAQIAYDYVSSGYSDWFLPSKDELQEFYNFFGGDIFNHNDFWSSSEYDNNMAWNINTNNYMHPANKYDSYRGLMPIRSFGNWTIDCMDEAACNYNPEANMADGSCTYAEQGYDCDGNNIQIEGFTFLGRLYSSSYYISNESSNWGNYNTICENLGGHLATISSIEENTFITQLLENYDDSNPNGLHIGLSDEGSEGIWYWITNEESYFLNWDSGEPNNMWGGQNYAEIYLNGLWNDIGGNEVRRALLEIEN